MTGHADIVAKLRFLANCLPGLQEQARELLREAADLLASDPGRQAVESLRGVEDDNREATGR